MRPDRLPRLPSLGRLRVVPGLQEQAAAAQPTPAEGSALLSIQESSGRRSSRTELIRVALFELPFGLGNHQPRSGWFGSGEIMSGKRPSTLLREAIGLGGFLVLATIVQGQELGLEERRPAASPPPRLEPALSDTYNSLDAGREAHQRGEARRRETIDAQVGIINELVWYNTWIRPYGLAPSLAARYAYPYFHPYRAGWRRFPRRFSRALRAYPGVYGPVFEPWPWVPGDIWGYPFINRVEQPLGHKVIQTGPNSYIYRPVYPWDLQPAEGPESGPRSSPERARQAPGRTDEPPAAPAEEVPPPPPVDGPRLF